MILRLVFGNYALLLLLVGVIILGSSELSYGGKTSSFLRSNDLSLDMPLDSDVFQVPPGYNAPEQVLRLV